MSPEAASGKPVDQRADLYAAALVLYRMVAGRGPFDHAASESKLLAAHANEQPAPPSRFAGQAFSPELDFAILRALRKRPDERFQSADEMRAELERLISALPESSTRPSSPARETEHPAFAGDHEERASAQLETHAASVRALPVARRMSNLWLFLAAAVVTAAATAALVALLVGAR
jgi:serine/threonine protein kinase